MSINISLVIVDLIKFFEDRNLLDVALGLKEDLNLKNQANQQSILTSVRKAIARTEKH